MSNTEGSLERSARRHRPAIWGIVISLVAALLAYLVYAFRPAPEAVPADAPAAIAPADSAAPTGTTTGPATTTAPATTN